MLWEADSRSFFTTDDRSVISTALAWLSKTVPASCSEIANPVRGIVDEVDASRVATVKAKKEV